MVCCSVDCPLPLKTEVFESFTNQKQQCCVLNEVEKIIEHQKSYASQSVVDVSDVHFMDVTSELVLTEAKRLNIISESTYRNIMELQREETDRFRSKAEDKTYSIPNHEVDNVSTLKPGQLCYFMYRFIVTWGLKESIDESALSGLFTCGMDFVGKSWNCSCLSCVVDHSTGLELRNMIESDWLYLGKLSKHPPPNDYEQKGVTKSNEIEQTMEKKTSCFHYACASAWKALRLLKSIPVAARRSLPVLVNQHGQLISIPVSQDTFCYCSDKFSCFSTF